MPDSIPLAVIGGSGLYNMTGLANVEERHISTPFGPPSDPVVVGELNGQRVAFLARHGKGHRYNPSEVNYRANIYALKVLGVEQVISVSACGSLREDYAPGHIVIPDQIYDNTKGRERSFFGRGLVAHISVADPFCSELSAQLYDAVRATSAAVHRGGSFVTIEGPRFSTKAESQVFRTWGMSIIGMTASPEAFLAREAEMCYACMAHVTDYDVWHITEAPVTVEMVVRILNQNTSIAQQAIANLAGRFKSERKCGCGSALKDALITDRARIPQETRDTVKLMAAKYLSS